MTNQKLQLNNCFVLLMGFPGVGKRTIGEALARKTNVRFTGNHDLYDQILKLFGDDYHAMWNLTPAMWEKLNAAQDLYLSTISSVCNSEDSFIFSEMMFDKDTYHQIFYGKVLAVSKKRNAHFFPVRLICDEDELAKRVASDDRKHFSNFKTRDTELSRKRSRDEEVFYSHHENEITIDNTHLSPDEVADHIIKHIKNHEIKKIIAWGIEYLSAHGYVLKNNTPEDVQIRPWSYVIRYETSMGWVYLKRTPTLIAEEASITKILHDQFHAPVPEVIASNSTLHCFLTKDAGNALRPILKKKFDADLLCKMVDTFTSMQLTVSDNINLLINNGVPDFRLYKLADLYAVLISKKDMLIADGLSEKEIDALTLLTPFIADLCVKLADYAIPQTLVQPDFHDNNALIDTVSQKITIIDLGEIVISHPFFSLINFLQQVKKHHGLTDQDNAYQKIKTACFKNFISRESHDNLIKAFKSAEILLPVYSVLASYRLIEACDKTEFTSFYGSGKLRDELLHLREHVSRPLKK